MESRVLKILGTNRPKMQPLSLAELGAALEQAHQPHPQATPRPSTIRTTRPSRRSRLARTIMMSPAATPGADTREPFDSIDALEASFDFL